MKSFIYFIILLNSFYLLNSVIPNWELTKIATKLTTTFPYSYTAYEDDWYEFHLTLTRTIFFKKIILLIIPIVLQYIIQTILVLEIQPMLIFLQLEVFFTCVDNSIFVQKENIMYMI